MGASNLYGGLLKTLSYVDLRVLSDNLRKSEKELRDEPELERERIEKS